MEGTSTNSQNDINQKKLYSDERLRYIKSFESAQINLDKYLNTISLAAIGFLVLNRSKFETQDCFQSFLYYIVFILFSFSSLLLFVSSYFSIRAFEKCIQMLDIQLKEKKIIQYKNYFNRIVEILNNITYIIFVIGLILVFVLLIKL